jgi:hypothetical protein
MKQIAILVLIIGLFLVSGCIEDDSNVGRTLLSQQSTDSISMDIDCPDSIKLYHHSNTYAGALKTSPTYTCTLEVINDNTNPIKIHNIANLGSDKIYPHNIEVYENVEIDSNSKHDFDIKIRGDGDFYPASYGTLGLLIEYRKDLGHKVIEQKSVTTSMIFTYETIE